MFKANLFKRKQLKDYEVTKYYNKTKNCMQERKMDMNCKIYNQIKSFLIRKNRAINSLICLFNAKYFKGHITKDQEQTYKSYLDDLSRLRANAFEYEQAIMYISDEFERYNVLPCIDVVLEILSVKITNPTQADKASVSFEGRDIEAKAKVLEGQEIFSISAKVKVTNAVADRIENIGYFTGTDITIPPADPNIPSIPEVPSNKVENELKPNPIIEKIVENKKAEYVKEDKIDYAIKVGNLEGGSTWKKVFVKDELKDTNLKYVAGSTKLDDLELDDSIVWNGNVLNVSVGDILSNQTRWIRFQVEVDKNAEVFSNKALVQAENTPPGTPNEPSVDVDGNVPIPNLYGIKEVIDANGKNINGGKVNRGDIVKNRITVANNVLWTTAKDVNVKDILEDGQTFKEGSLKLNGKAIQGYSNGQVSVKVGDLEVDKVNNPAKAVVEFETIVNKDAIGKIKNTAVMQTNDPDIPKDKVPPITPIEYEVIPPSPIVEKTMDKKAVKVDEIATYNIKVKNDAKEAIWKDVVINDNIADKGYTLEKNTTKVNGKSIDDSNIWTNAEVLRFEVGNLNAGQSIEIEYKVKIAKYQEKYNNEVNVESSNYDEVVTNIDTPTEHVKSNIVVSKTINSEKSLLKVDDEYVYTITAENIEKDARAESVVVKDIVPDGLEIKDVVVTGVNDSKIEGDRSKNEVLVNVGRLEGLEKVVVKIKVLVNGNVKEEISNIATVTGTDITIPPTEPNKPNITENTPPVVNNTELKPSIVKSYDLKQSKYHRDDKITFTIMAKNTEGSRTWKNVVVHDAVNSEYLKVDAESIKVNGESTTNQGQANDIKVNVGDIKGGESKEVTFDVTVIKDTDLFMNKATASGDNNPNDPKDPNIPYVPEDGVEVPGIVPVPIIEAKEEVYNLDEVDKNGQVVNNKDEVIYRIKVRNTQGYSNAKNVVMNEVMDDKYQIISDTLKYNGKVFEGNKRIEGNKLYMEIGDLDNSDIKDTKQVEYSIIEFHAIIQENVIGKVRNDITFKANNIVDPYDVEEVEIFIKAPELGLTKTVNKDFVKDNEEVEFKLNVVNNGEKGSIAKNVILSDSIKNKPFEYVKESTRIDGQSVKDSDYWNEEFNDFKAIWKELAAGSKHEVTFKVIVKDIANEYQNKAVVKADNNKEVTSIVTFQTKWKEAKLKIEKSLAQNVKATVNVGDIFEYILNISNPVNDSRLVDVNIKDKLPKYLKIEKNGVKVDDKEAIVDTKSAMDEVNVKLKALDGGKAVKVSVLVKVLPDANGDLENVAFASGKDYKTKTNIEAPSNKVIVKVPAKEKVYKTKGKKVANKVDNLEKNKKLSIAGKTLPVTGNQALFIVCLFAIIGLTSYKIKRKA